MYPGFVIWHVVVIFWRRRCLPFLIQLCIVIFWRRKLFHLLQLYIVNFWRRKLSQFLLELGQFFKCVLLAAIEFQQLGLVSFVTAWRQAAIKKS